MNLLTWLSRKRFPYEPLVTVEVSRSRLLHNLAEFRKMAPKLAFAPEGAVAPVLKSNGYGHGLLEVAKILEKSGGTIPFFIVDSYYEAVALRAKGIRTPLVVVGYTRPEIIAKSRLAHTAFAVTSLETLGQLPHGLRHMPIHLKIDTGMHRQGILPEEADRAIKLIGQNHRIVLEGICSHLSDADDPDESFTETQIHIWNRTARKFREAFPHMRYTHLSATDGHRYTKEIEANVSRLGIGLYGLSENPIFVAKLGLKPVMSLKTLVTGVKRIKAGETIGYGNTWKAAEDMIVATVPVGYFEGVDRRLSSGPQDQPVGFIQVGPSRLPCPIVGRVSMNITSIDVSNAPGAKIGDTAIVISNEASDENSIASIAQKCRTISYEIAVKIPEHLKRVVVE